MKTHSMTRLVALLSCLAALACNPPSPPPGAEEATETKASESDKSGTAEGTGDTNTIPAPPDVAAPPPDAVKTPSGLATKLLTKGTGDKSPAPQDKVSVHYTGWTTDGKMFDSSVTRGQPASFPLDGVIKGWTEGLQVMVEGEKTRFWIPEALAYQGRSAPFGMLVFDVELIKIN